MFNVPVPLDPRSTINSPKSDRKSICKKLMSLDVKNSVSGMMDFLFQEGKKSIHY